MKSKRLLEIAKYVDINDSILDVGCDHAYLSIYLKKNNLCKNVIASDISKNALEYAQKNIAKAKLDINTYVSDGLNNITEFYDTVIISGMGTNTILHILDYKELPNKLIISSQNELYKLRKNLNLLGYTLKEESIVYENNHYYVIMNCIKGKQKLSNKELMYGISDNREYYLYLYNKNKDILNKVNISKKIKLCFENLILKQSLKKSRRI